MARLRLACLMLFLVAASMAALSQTTSGVVTLAIEPKEQYIERRNAEQVVNFDLLLHNSGTLPVAN